MIIILLVILAIPAGILQYPHFHHEVPNYMNYGAIGMIVGHELTHGFDNEGRQYDDEGNLANWWSNTTSDEYIKKAQCLIDQYGNYTVEEVDMNVRYKFIRKKKKKLFIFRSMEKLLWVKILQPMEV